VCVCVCEREREREREREIMCVCVCCVLCVVWKGGESERLVILTKTHCTIKGKQQFKKQQYKSGNNTNN
jgi:hypothetical protein